MFSYLVMELCFVVVCHQLVITLNHTMKWPLLWILFSWSASVSSLNLSLELRPVFVFSVIYTCNHLPFLFQNNMYIHKCRYNAILNRKRQLVVLVYIVSSAERSVAGKRSGKDRAWTWHCSIALFSGWIVLLPLGALHMTHEINKINNFTLAKIKKCCTDLNHP